MKVNRTWLLIIVIVVAVGVLYLVNHFTSSSQPVPNHGEMSYPSDDMEYSQGEMSAEVSDVQPNDNMVMNANAPQHAETNQSEVPMDSQMQESMTAGTAPKDQLTPSELLPQGQADLWAQAYPEGQGSLKDVNFLQAGHHIGIDTVGNLSRNANRQLRSEVPNPQVPTGIWLQSTIQPDLMRRPLEVGGCA